jgi:hypothetical protein
MRRPLRLALTVAMVALVPLAAYAQGTAFFAQPFQYTDVNGPGTLTVTPLSTDSTRFRFQPVGVTLTQGSATLTGSGVYHYLGDDDPNLPPFVLLSFTLVDGQGGNARVYQGTLAATSGFSGSGTYWLATAPQNTAQWEVKSIPPPPPAIINSTPTLTSFWQQNNFAEAIGGVYASTFNTQTTPDSTATWQGTLPAAGNYTVEVFIPRQPSSNSVPRTQNATYQIFVGGFVGAATKQASQAVTSSQWVSLGTFSFTQNYRILLTDVTGERTGTRSVVANAVRLTAVTGSPTP